jgi:hypothetical protein
MATISLGLFSQKTSGRSLRIDAATLGSAETSLACFGSLILLVCLAQSASTVMMIRHDLKFFFC